MSGRAWLVENGATGEVLLAHDAHQRVPIASITKLMTVLLTLEHTRLDDVVTIATQARPPESSPNHSWTASPGRSEGAPLLVLHDSDLP